MSEDLRVDKDYKEAFNEGYELSRELGLKPDILDGLAAGKGRMKAMKDGMLQYDRELTETKDKNIPKDLKSFDFDKFQPKIEHDRGKETKDKGKGMDMDMEL